MGKSFEDLLFEKLSDSFKDRDLCKEITNIAIETINKENYKRRFVLTAYYPIYINKYLSHNYN